MSFRQSSAALPVQELYYKRDEDVASDTELQAWWTEITTKGHADATPGGWPDGCETGINTVAALSEITTTMAWMASAHHAAGAGKAWPATVSPFRLCAPCCW